MYPGLPQFEDQATKKELYIKKGPGLNPETQDTPISGTGGETGVFRDNNQVVCQTVCAC